MSNIPCSYICSSITQFFNNFLVPSPTSIVKCSVTLLVSEVHINWPECTLYFQCRLNFSVCSSSFICYYIEIDEQKRSKMSKQALVSSPCRPLGRLNMQTLRCRHKTMLMQSFMLLFYIQVAVVASAIIVLAWLKLEI